MKRITYPLLCFSLSETSVLGLLVGTPYQAMERSVRKLKTQLSDELQRNYKKSGEYPYLDIKEPRLRMLEVSVRPMYRHERGAYPLGSLVNISTPLIYGEAEQEAFPCFLPLLNVSFFCYHLHQLDTLAKHFVLQSLDNVAPETLYRHAAYPTPELDVIVLKIDENMTFNYDWEVTQTPENLERLAERYPYPKSQRRLSSAFPDAAWELDEYVKTAYDTLMIQKTSLLVVGNPGVGKSAVLKQAFRKIAGMQLEDSKKKSIWRIQAQRFTATSKYLGEWQETAEKLVNELTLQNGMLWVDDIVQLLKDGGRSAQDSVAAYLLPFMQDDRLQLVGEVTPQGLESMRRMLPGFVESVQVMEIPELPEKKIQAIFEEFSNYVRQNLKINLGKDALGLAMRLLRRYYPYESFPGKGIRFLSECVNDAQLGGREDIKNPDIIAHFIRRTGLPELFLRDDLLLDTQQLRHFFGSRILGQPEAVEKLCDIVKIFKAGLNNPHKPITTLIFAGPTGVGKTASALSLAQYFFGVGQRQSPLIRIDMSEFQHPSQISRLIGAGKEPGKMVSDVRERPFAVLLLDEAEKAAPALFDAFLTVLDEGMLTDAFGRVTNFRNCIIILTTNLGASNRRSIGYGDRAGDDEAKYRSAIGAYFRPEFMNRIDSILMFQPLGKEAIRQITLKELEEVKQREGFTKKNLEIVFSENVVNYLSGIGFHERFGARPLQRALEDHIVKPLAGWLLKNKAGDCRLEVDFTEKITVRRL